MPDDPPTELPRGSAAPDPPTGEAAARRDAVIVAGHRGDAAAARQALADPHPAVRGAGLGALARTGDLRPADVVTALGDPSASVRRRAGVAAATVAGRGARSTLPAALRHALADPDPLVAEAACWALGERRSRAAVPDLMAVAGGHPDTRCREAAVAALGTVGDPAGLPGVLGALDDKPTVRRRAAVALVAFEGPEVAQALQRCLADHDWQVRQAAEILLDPSP